MVVSSFALPGDLGTKLIRASGAGGGEPSRELHAFIKAVAHAFDAALAGVTIVVADRLWTGPTVGIAPGWCDPAARFFRTVVQSNAPVVVANTLTEDNWRSDGFVSASGVRSYAGVPLRHDSQVIGTLWIADRRPRVFSSEHEKSLAALADAFLMEVAVAGDAAPATSPTRIAGSVGFFDADLVGNAASIAGCLFVDVAGAGNRISLTELVDRIPEEQNRARVCSLLDTIRNSDGPFERTILLSHTSGTHRAFAVNGVTERSPGGEPVRASGAVVEISSLHERHRDTQQLARKLDLATRAAAVGVWDWDVVENRATFTDTWLEIYGLSEGGFGFDRWLEFVHPDDRAHVQEAHAAALAGEGDMSLSFRIRRSDGAERRIRATAVVMRDESGRALRMIGTNIDITADVERTELLSITSERLTLAVEASGAGVWDYDFRTRTTVWDAAMFRIYGRKHPHPPTRDEWINYIHPEERDAVVRQSKADLVAGRPMSLRYRIVRDDGSIRHLQIHGTVRLNEQGHPVRCTGVARDVTREQQTIDELVASEERFRLLADNTSDWVGITAIDGTPIYDSPSFFRISGWTEEDIRSTPLESRIHPDDRSLLHEHLRTLAAGSQSKVRYRYRIKNGTYMWRDCHSTPIRDHDGRVSRFVWSSRDLTAEIEATDALRASERNYRLLADHSLNWVGLNKADGTRVYTSPSFFRSSGWTESDVESMPRESRYHPDDAHLIRENVAIVRSGRQNRYRHRYLHKDGTYRWMECVSSPITDANGVVTHYTWSSRDIHEEVVAHQSLHDSEERYRLLADHSQDWVGLSRIDGTSIYNSPSFYRSSGWTEEDLRVNPRESRLHPDDMPALARNFELLRRGERSRFRHRYLFKDGKYRWMDCASSPILGDDGKPAFFVWTSRDITLEMEALHALRTSEERYRLLAENTDDIVGTSDPDGTLTYVSPSVERILGWNANEILTNDWRTRVHPADADDVEKNELEVRNGSRTIIRYRTRHRLGHYVWLELRSFPINAPDNRLSRVIWTARDVTAQVRATAWDQSRAAVLEMITGGADLPAVLNALVSSVERSLPNITASVGIIQRENGDEWLCLAFGPSLPAAVLEWGSQKFPINANTGSCGPAIINRRRHVIDRIATSPNFGSSAEFLAAHGLQAVWSEPIVATTGVPLGTFAIFRGHPGQPDAAELSLVTEAAKLAAIAIENRRAEALMQRTMHDLATARDAISLQADELKRRNDDLAAANAESEKLRARAEEDTRVAVELRHRADAASRAKMDFLANMSHEIRTPMTAILGFADLLAEQGGVDAPRNHAEMAASIRRNAEHLLTIINDVLDLSKIEAGKLQIELVACSPRQIIQDVMSLLGPKASEKGLTLSLTSGNMVPDWLTTDPTRLRQIAVNLIGNAIKFTHTGGVSVSIEFSPPLPGMNRGVLRLAVTDSGIGLSEEQRSSLFEVFHQADTSTTRRFGGTGLGLAISRRLARLLGGDIAVESKPGHGSTFTLIITAPVAERPLSAPTPGATDAFNLGGRILIAEDGEDNQKLLRHYFSRAKADFEIVSDGKQALERALAEAANGTPFDVILMDMQMPVLDGYTAVRRLREHGYKLPIAALTANVLHEQRQRAIAAGCDDFVGKPFDRKKLFECCQRLMERSRSLRGPIAKQ